MPELIENVYEIAASPLTIEYSLVIFCCFQLRCTDIFGIFSILPYCLVLHQILSREFRCLWSCFSNFISSYSLNIYIKKDCFKLISKTSNRFSWLSSLFPRFNLCLTFYFVLPEPSGERIFCFAEQHLLILSVKNFKVFNTFFNLPRRRNKKNYQPPISTWRDGRRGKKKNFKR